MELPKDFIDFSWTLPMTASAARARETSNNPVNSKEGSKLMSARVKKIKPIVIKFAAKASNKPYRLP